MVKRDGDRLAPRKNGDVRSEIVSEKNPRETAAGTLGFFDHAPQNAGRSVDVVLLPMEGGVGLDDYVFVRGLLEFVDEHGLAGF